MTFNMRFLQVREGDYSLVPLAEDGCGVVGWYNLNASSQSINSGGVDRPTKSINARAQAQRPTGRITQGDDDVRVALHDLPLQSVHHISDELSPKV